MDETPLHVSSDEGGEHPVLLLQKSLGFVVLHDVSSLHHNDQVGREDGVHSVLQTHNTDAVSVHDPGGLQTQLSDDFRT